MLNNNKQGQAMMIGLMILVMSILIFIATLPAVQTVIDGTRGCDALNCEGFIDSDASGVGCSATNKSYDPDLTQNALSCTILDLFVPFVILGVLIGLITALLHGNIVDKPKEEDFSFSRRY